MDEIRDTEKGRPPKELTISQRKFMMFYFRDGLPIWKAYDQAVPQTTKKRTKASCATNGGVMMTRIREGGYLDEVLRAAGFDSVAIATVIVDASKATKVVFVGKGGVTVGVPDHAIRLKAAIMGVGILFPKLNGHSGDGGGDERHLHIHLPGKTKDSETWEANTKVKLEWIQKTQDLEAKLEKANQKLEKYET